jgi:poly(hydroxyalkanoate) depolymerase family esterase
VERSLNNQDEFLAGVFRTDAGERRYKLFRPGVRPPAGRRTLVVVLHGCTQDADDIARGTRLNAAAARDGFIALYPEQPASANALKCWNWFVPDQSARGLGEAAIIAELAAKVAREEGIAPGRTVITGISAGGAMAANLVADYPELWAAVALHSGLPAHVARSQPEAVAVMTNGAKDPDALGRAALETMGAHARMVPALLLHGGADHLVSPLNLRATARQFAVMNAMAAGAPVPEPIALPSTDARSTGQRWALADGRVVAESWRFDGVGHAWSGGDASGTYTDPAGPDATALVLEFFNRMLAR